MKPNPFQNQQTIKSLIVDDEQQCRETLQAFLNEYCPDVEIIGDAANIEEAYRLIILKKPDLVFLDVSMPPSDGFELLRKFQKLNFEVVFTTAYNQFAIQAIRFSATDYLLKPIDPVELITAVGRVREKKEKNAENKEHKGKLVLFSDKSYFFVDPDSILHMELQSRKIVILLKDGKKHEVSKSIQEMEELLDSNFIRCHKSFIININEIKEYVPDKNGGCVIMTNSKIIPVAQRRKDVFLNAFSGGNNTAEAS